MQPIEKQRALLSRHVSAASVDTNASAIAESTISLGLSRFPEPPSSIPSTPIRTNFNGTSPASSLRSFARPSAPPVVPLRNFRPQDKQSNLATSSIPSSSSNPSFKATAPPFDPPQSSSGSHIISASDWHDGASSIDVDATEDRLLPTSFITSLLQENQQLRKSKRGSYGSDAFSGISEMTYPPLVGNRRPNTSSRPPPSSYTSPQNRMSGDSETLHSLQDHPPTVSTASVTRLYPGNRVSVVGVAAATLRSMSDSSQISSTRDSDTLGGSTKGYQRKLSTAYESGDETADYKAFTPLYNQTTSVEPQRRLLQETARQVPYSRDSLHSHQSAAPSFISRISGLSLRRVFNWRKAKPLPPVPKIPDISLAAESAHRKDEETTPLPDLVNRAGVLRDLLDRGRHPHHSVSSYHVLPAGVDSSSPRETFQTEAGKQGYSNASYTSQLSPLHKRSASPPINSSSKNSPRTSRRKRFWIIGSIIGILILAAIGIGVGLAVGKKKTSVSNCSGNFVGSLCNIDATCVCTSSSGCNGLAQIIIDLLPTVNQVFDVNITATLAYSSIWIMQGSPTTRSCNSQAVLLDVGTVLGQESNPNRTQWTQAALLWNAIQTQDLTSAQTLQNSVKALPWSNIASSDGPVEADPAFSITSSGFTFNFASQSLSLPSGSFISLGEPSNAQIAEVGANANATLNRMYTFAQASATQRKTALKQYWASVLLRRPEDLAVFKAAISISPIILPFNASSPAIRNLYVSSPSNSFPPPLSCFPDLSAPLQQAINLVESSVFGLPASPNSTQFDPQCYPDRPVYGVLDVLRLRLPFLDSQTGVSRQAVVLSRDASTRAIVYNGEMFSSISNTTATPASISSAQLNPQQYGTLTLADHVILQYLRSISNINIANNLIQFVLNTTSVTPVPPDVTSPLFQSLSLLPSLEVAVFGSIQASDLTSTVSPFTNPSNSLFFGSDDGSALRNWTINSSSGSVIWTQNATSPLIVRDKSLDPNTSISQVWNAAALSITFNVTTISLSNVTSSLQATNSFSSQ